MVSIVARMVKLPQSLASWAAAAAGGSALASVRFQTVTAWPDLLTRLVATAEPMAPRPMKPISTFDTPCDVLIWNRLPSPQDVGRRRKSRGRKPNRHSQLIQPSYRLGAQQSPVSRRPAASREDDSDVDILFMLRPRQKRTTGAGLRRSKIQSGQRRARQGRSGRVQVEARAGRGGCRAS